MADAARPCRGLPPLCGELPRVLILGSFPSVLSLSHHEYYGNPKNRFWAVMEELFGIPAELPYTRRCHHLLRKRVALWDVVARCQRQGSADSRIRDAVQNDIGGFICAHPSVRLIALNGSTAGRMYRRSGRIPPIPSIILPSTSPANAALPFAEKVRAWKAIREVYGPDPERTE